MKEYNDSHAKSGLDIKLPGIETFPNRFTAYTIRIEIPELVSAVTSALI